MAKEIVCAFGTDVDSVAGWIGSYGGGDSPSDIQRGIFASEVGIIRLRAGAESKPNGERREDPAPHTIATLRARRRSHPSVAHLTFLTGLAASHS